MSEKDAGGALLRKPMRRVSDLAFTDLYLFEDWRMARIKTSSIDAAGVIGGSPVPDIHNFEHDLQNIRKACASQKTNTFELEYDGVRYRVTAFDEVQLGLVYILRRFPNAVRDFNKIGFNTAVTDSLLRKDITGLVIICGAMNSGKTTTAASLIVERLKLYGGIGVTVEDPTELLLTGPHGDKGGFCFRAKVSNKVGGYAAAIRDIVLRSSADVVLLGEIRDSSAAIEALRFCHSGHLVITTFHAENPISALIRLNDMSGEVAALLPDGVACVLHQRLNGNPRLLSYDFLNFFRERNEDGMRQRIKSREFKSLENDFKQQQSRLIYGGHQ